MTDRPGRPSETGDRDGGMVTVEAAVAFAAFAAVLALALGAVSAAVDQLRCTDAAREAARLAAQGDRQRAHAAAERIAPAGADITITTTGEEIAVAVRAEPAAGLIPGLELHAEAFAVAEPAGAPP